VAGSVDLFEGPDIREDLHATIRIAGRIAGHFYRFLVKSGEKPCARAIVFVTDTIRWGIGEFFDLAYICKVIDARRDTWAFKAVRPLGFPSTAGKVPAGFKHLAESPEQVRVRNWHCCLP
jgi:hypothetical protein